MRQGWPSGGFSNGWIEILFKIFNPRHASRLSAPTDLTVYTRVIVSFLLSRCNQLLSTDTHTRTRGALNMITGGFSASAIRRIIFHALTERIQGG